MNKRAIKELQDTSQSYPQWPGLELSLAPVACMTVASNTRERKESSGHQINNIRVANIVILKWLISNKTKDIFDDLAIYSITATTWS